MRDSQVVPVSIGKWKVKQKLGEGSFGCIYSAIQSDNNEALQVNEEVAIKTESINNIKQMLLMQYKIYKEMEGIKGFPRVYEYVEEERFSYLVMEKLELTLDRYAARKYPNRFLPAPILLQLMVQTLLILENLHQKGYLYRDMKPSNLMVKAPFHQVFIIDFGLCKQFMCNDRHIAQRNNKKMVGTPIFCSLNTHAGLEQARRDDLQSWIFTNLYFGLELPWESVISRKDLTKQLQNQQMYNMKKQTKLDQLIKEVNQAREPNSRVPLCIAKIMEDIDQLGFEDEPRYEDYRKLIRNEYSSLTHKDMEECSIDWEMEPKKEQVKKVSKINFKAPLKSKQATMGVEQLTQKQADKEEKEGQEDL